MAAKFDLSISWSKQVDSSKDDKGGLVVSFESGIGPWPGLKEPFLQILNSMVRGNKLDPLLLMTVMIWFPVILRFDPQRQQITRK